MKKKILALALAAVMVFSFAACSDEDKNPVDIKMSKYMTVEQLDNFEVEATLYELTDEDVEAATRDLFNAMSEPVGIIDRAVENGDWVNIDFVGYKDEVAFDGGSSQGELLEIGSGTFIDGFEDGLIGVTPGQPVDLNLKFPENYTNADLAGQDVVFNVTVNFIVPEINDTTVADLITDGCNMGVKTLNKYLNQYEAADHTSKDICNRLISIEETLCKDLKQYL